jgi:hypothetical protein
MTNQFLVNELDWRRAGIADAALGGYNKSSSSATA